MTTAEAFYSAAKGRPGLPQKVFGDTFEGSVTVPELQKLAIDLKMSMDDVFLVKEVFESYDTDCSGTLSTSEFGCAVSKILRMQLGEEATVERVDSLTGWHWWNSDVDTTGAIAFGEFLGWYASNGFNEELMTSENQRELRKIAKAYGVSVTDVEDIKAQFDACDTDQSGEVEFDEFENILHRCLKVPENAGIPPSRVRYFWAQIDTDGSGNINFHEFFRWWLKYFPPAKRKPDVEQTETCAPDAPFEAFYKQVRRMGNLDPPPYPDSKRAEPEENEDGIAQTIFGHIGKS